VELDFQCVQDDPPRRLGQLDPDGLGAAELGGSQVDVECQVVVFGDDGRW
jgi:hypothetical protein